MIVFACDSFFFFAKVAGPLVLQYFCEIFDGLCKLAADPEKGVQDGALLLNKLLQDVVRECDVFDLERFVPLLERRIYHPGPAVRQFLIGWVRLLDSVPNLDMLHYLPNILDGMLHMLGDRHAEIAREVGSTLSGFLGEIKARADTPVVEFGTLTTILVRHCGDEGNGSQDEYTHYVALGWLHQFVVSGCDRLLPFSSQLLSAILPSMSHDVDEIRDTAILANEELLRLISSTKAAVPIDKMLEKIMMQFLNPNVESRLAALNWVRILHQKDASALAPFFADLFPALIKKIGDPSEKVVSFSLEVMAMISQREDYFSRLVTSLVDMFAADQGLQSARGALIIRQLSLFIDPAQIFTAIARILVAHENLTFCASMVQTLSVILLTARELQHLRDRLRSFHSSKSPDPVIAAFFVVLYEAFCHNAVATVSLCLLCELYEHATTLLVIIGGMDMTVEFLCELDKLVQLIESPVFASMRLQLLEPVKYPFLFRSLYALLMILPQSAAFVTLHRRLSCVSSGPLQQHVLQQQQQQLNESSRSVLQDAELTSKFQDVQQRHERRRAEQRLSSERKTLNDQTRQGRKLMDSLKKKQAVL